MASNGLRDLLSRVKLPSDEEAAQLFAAELKAALAALNQPEINGDFRNDILKIFTASLDLMKTVSKPVYQVDEILLNLSLISSRISFLLHHVSNSRPRTPGFGPGRSEQNDECHTPHDWHIGNMCSKIDVVQLFFDCQGKAEI